MNLTKELLALEAKNRDRDRKSRFDDDDRDFDDAKRRRLDDRARARARLDKLRSRRGGSYGIPQHQTEDVVTEKAHYTVTDVHHNPNNVSVLVFSDKGGEDYDGINVVFSDGNVDLIADDPVAMKEVKRNRKDIIKAAKAALKNDPDAKKHIKEGVLNEERRSAEQLEIGDEVEITGSVNFKGHHGEITRFGRDKHFVVVKLNNGGEHSFHSSDVSEVEDLDDFDDDDDSEDRDDVNRFYVAFYDEDQERSWIGMITKEGGGKWHEKPFAGKPDHRWGTSYMSYLTPDDIMTWIYKDYDRSIEVEGPFYDEEEARDHVKHNWGKIEESVVMEADRKKTFAQLHKEAVGIVQDALGVKRKSFENQKGALVSWFDISKEIPESKRKALAKKLGLKDINIPSIYKPNTHFSSRTHDLNFVREVEGHQVVLRTHKTEASRMGVEESETFSLRDLANMVLSNHIYENVHDTWQKGKTKLKVTGDFNGLKKGQIVTYDSMFHGEGGAVWYVVKDDKGKSHDTFHRYVKPVKHSVKESVYTNYSDWKEAIVLSYPAHAKDIKFRGRMEGQKTTIIASIPGKVVGTWEDAANYGVLKEEKVAHKVGKIISHTSFPTNEDGEHHYWFTVPKNDHTQLQNAKRLFARDPNSKERWVIVGEPEIVQLPIGKLLAQPMMDVKNWKQNYNSTINFESIPSKARYRYWVVVGVIDEWEDATNTGIILNDSYDDDFERFEPATNMCPKCEGKGKVKRDGKMIECDRCDGVGEVFEAFDDDDFERFEPATNMCPDCEGKGKVKKNGKMVNCERCDGVGEVFEEVIREDVPVNATEIIVPSGGLDVNRMVRQLERLGLKQGKNMFIKSGSTSWIHNAVYTDEVDSVLAKFNVETI